MDDTKAIIERMMMGTKTKSKRELGEIVGGNVYQALNTGKIPKRWFDHLADKHGLNVEWLKTGLGIPATDKTAEAEEIEPEPEVAESTQEPEAEPAQEAVSDPEPEPQQQKEKEPAPNAKPLAGFFEPKVDVISIAEIPTEDLFKELSRRLAPDASVIISSDMGW